MTAAGEGRLAERLEGLASANTSAVASQALREAAAELRRLEAGVEQCPQCDYVGAGRLVALLRSVEAKRRAEQAEAEVKRLREALQLIAGDGPLPPSKCCSQCVAKAALSGASAQGPEE